MTALTQPSPLPDRTTYDRTACKIGIVHLGYGAFHRAHQAIYIDDYMEQTGDLDWGIAAVNLRHSESASFTKSSQIRDGYLVKTTAHDGSLKIRMVRSHIHFSDWSSTPGAAEELLSQPTVHIVSITVTESGYYVSGDGQLDVTSPIIAGEISGGEVTSVYGYLARALSKRAATIDQPLSVLCCDNIRSNGVMLRKNILAYLDASNMKDLAKWVSRNVSFPSSMVDRITPRVTADLQAEVSSIFGEENVDPIHAEAFSQWVVEDNFSGSVPDLGKVGVEVVADVDPYEESKIRILNGGHTALSYFGALAGFQTFDEAMRDTELRSYFDNYQQLEVLPGLTIELPFNKETYLAKVAARFENKAIADQLERICMDGYSKMQLYICPTLRSCLDQGIVPIHGFDCIASWYVYARRFKEGTMPVLYHEPYWEQLSPLLETGQEVSFARHSNLWGDIAEIYPGFEHGITTAIQKIEKLWPA